MTKGGSRHRDREEGDRHEQPRGCPLVLVPRRRHLRCRPGDVRPPDAVVVPRWARGRWADNRALRSGAGAGTQGRARPLGRYAARAAGTDRRAGPVLAHRLPRLAPLLLTGRESPGACRRGNRRGDGPRAHPHGADLLLDAPRPLGGSNPPGADRPPPRGGSGQRTAAPEADGRIRGLSGQGGPRRDSALRAPPTPQRDTGACLHARRAGVPEDRDTTALAPTAFLRSIHRSAWKGYSPKFAKITHLRYAPGLCSVLR